MRYLTPASRLRLAPPEIRDHGVERDREDLEPEEERGEVGAGREHAAAEGREKQQQEELFGVAAPPGEVVGGEDDDHRGRRDEQGEEEECETVDEEQRRDLHKELPIGQR